MQQLTVAAGPTVASPALTPPRGNPPTLTSSSSERAFGEVTQTWRSGLADSPKRDLESLLYIAEILSRFDVVAVQEVRGNLKCLREALKALGPDWGLILTDVTKGA